MIDRYDNATHFYFSSHDERLSYGDDRGIAVGVTHTVDVEPVLCESGLHASKRVIDALGYAPGTILWGVTLGGVVVDGGDKSVATERTYVWRLDCENLLREAARLFALEVIDLLDAPDVVRKYLETGDESLKAAAYAGASTAAKAGRRNVSNAADAATAATWAAASSAAWSAAWSAASAAAWAAARAADAAAAARTAARTAARDRQNTLLEDLIREALDE